MTKQVNVATMQRASARLRAIANKYPPKVALLSYIHALEFTLIHLIPPDARQEVTEYVVGILNELVSGLTKRIEAAEKPE